MIEFLFLITFAVVLVMTGLSFLGVAAAMLLGFVVMALAGMLGMVFKLLPWLILIVVVVWLVKDNTKKQSYHRRKY